ncbi:TraR/DksA family transcriptional regulator [Chloroflexota bacterium]
MAKKYEHLRARLEDEKKRLLEDVEQQEASARPTDIRREGSPFGKREEEATESLELEKRLAVSKQVQDHLNEIEHALHKFEEGTYGLCDSCGQQIAPDRLEALPQASLCVDCKERNAKSRPTTPGG